jgi:hypothetical protein
MAGPQREYFDTITAAVNDLVEHGFDSMDRVNYWTEEVRKAAVRASASPERLQQMLSNYLTLIYTRLVDQGQIARYHPGVAMFTVDRVRPELRAELNRRILASAELIKLKKAATIEKTLQRFQGWSTSLPKGPSRTTDKPEVKADITKALKQHTFEERRVLIDQGHKLTASINEVVAAGGGAIALVWHSHWRQAGYNYREDHKERDGEVYLLRNSWATERGLVKPGPAGWYDNVTAVAEEPYCRCYAQYLYNPRDLPAEMLTKKGEEQLALARRALAS